MCVGYIYEIYDLRTGLSIYVGSSIKPAMIRWAEHVILAFHGPLNRRKRVHRYMHAKGVENFNYRVREEMFYKTKQDLRKREQVWMDQLSPTCNERRASPASSADRRAHWAARRVLFECGCGSRISHPWGLNRHRKTTKHVRWLKDQQSHVLVVKSPE